MYANKVFLPTLWWFRTHDYIHTYTIILLNLKIIFCDRMFLLLRSVYGIMLMDANIFSYLVVSFVVATHIHSLLLGIVYVCACVILAKPYLYLGNTKKRVAKHVYTSLPHAFN